MIDWVNAHKMGFEINTEMNDLVVGMNDLGTILLVNRTRKGMDYGNLFICENKNGTWLKPVMLARKLIQSIKNLVHVLLLKAS